MARKRTGNGSCICASAADGEAKLHGMPDYPWGGTRGVGVAGAELLLPLIIELLGHCFGRFCLPLPLVVESFSQSPPRNYYLYFVESADSSSMICANYFAA